MMEKFLDDFNRTLSQTFGDAIDAASALPPRPASPGATVPGAFDVPSEEQPVIHRGVRCDHCQNTVKGIRYKVSSIPYIHLSSSYAFLSQCMNCPNFDLVSSPVSPLVLLLITL